MGGWKRWLGRQMITSFFLIMVSRIDNMNQPKIHSMDLARLQRSAKGLCSTTEG